MLSVVPSDRAPRPQEVLAQERVRRPRRQEDAQRHADLIAKERHGRSHRPAMKDPARHDRRRASRRGLERIDAARRWNREPRRGLSTSGPCRSRASLARKVSGASIPACRHDAVRLVLVVAALERRAPRAAVGRFQRCAPPRASPDRRGAASRFPAGTSPASVRNQILRPARARWRGLGAVDPGERVRAPGLAHDSDGLSARDSRESTGSVTPVMQRAASLREEEDRRGDVAGLGQHGRAACAPSRSSAPPGWRRSAR